jgi:hypothetical protein
VSVVVCAELPVFCDCCGKWVWPSGEPEVWEETWELAREQQPRTLHLRADAGPCITEC